MSRIDVSDLLSDPDFVDKMVQIKRSPSVDNRGRNVLAEKEISTVGCVQPASGRTIFRMPEEFRVANVSEFFMKGTITATAPGKYSDVLVFKGQRYNVQLVFDWSNWGLGYCEGTCIAEVPA
jgi:hypothetical protein